MSIAGAEAATVRAPRVGLVLNPRTRRAVRARERLVRELEQRGAAPPVVLATTVESPGAAQAAELLQVGVDLVVVAGGDGTVRGVVSALTGAGVPLAILPTGTANLFARNLGLASRRPAAALSAALDGHDLALDVGQAWVRIADDPARRHGPLPFLVMAGIGRDARTVAATCQRLKGLLGWIAYLAAGAGQALRPALPMLVDLDGSSRQVRTWTVLFGNFPRIRAGIAVFPHIRPDDGLLECLQVPLRHVLEWVGVAAHGLVGRPRRVRVLEYSLVSRARVVPEQPQPVQLDGDVVPDVVELEVGLAPGALLVRVPQPRRALPGWGAGRRLSRSRPGPRPDR